MCPTVIVRPDKSTVAVGGAGGRFIPSALFSFLLHYVVQSEPLDTAMAGPRLHSVGTPAAVFEPAWPRDETAYLTHLGFKLRTGKIAHLSAVSFNAATGQTDSAER